MLYILLYYFKLLNWLFVFSHKSSKSITTRGDFWVIIPNFMNYINHRMFFSCILVWWFINPCGIFAVITATSDWISKQKLLENSQLSRGGIFAIIHTIHIAICRIVKNSEWYDYLKLNTKRTTTVKCITKFVLFATSNNILYLWLYS